MAEYSRAQLTKHPGEASTTGMAEVRGKIDYYGISKSRYESAHRKRQEAEVQFEEAAKQFIKKDAKLQKWKTECSKLSDELCSMKKLSPEAAPLLSDFIPFHDIPLTVTLAAAPLPGASLEQQLTGEFSITQKLLMAACSIRDLERRYELLQVLLKGKTDEVQRLTEELKHSETDVQQQKEKINQLNAEIDKLKASMSPVGSSTALSPTGEVQLSTPFNSLHLTTSEDVDPAVMQAKIKELKDRISELLNHNLQWKERCDGLMSDLEAAKRELSECQQSTEQKLQDEREKTNRAVAERDDALERYRYLADVEVPRLENNIRFLEEQQHLQSGQRGVVVGTPPSSSNEDVQSELMATLEQMEEYRLGLEEERQSHQRTKENAQSLKQQWQDLYRELQAKKKELTKANADLERMQKKTQRCHSLLEQANSDRELIRGRLSEHDPDESGSRESGSSVGPSRNTGSSPKAKPRRGTLEEDTPTAVIGGRREQPDNWTCEVCCQYNSGSLVECKVCKSNKGRVVSYPVQESQAPLADNQHALMTTIRKPASVISSSSSSNSSSNKPGRSRLEEDGATPCLLHAVL